MSYQKYIILSLPRSGTNFLAYLLASHPQVKSFGEIFHKGIIWSHPAKPWLQNNAFYLIYRNLFPISFINRYIYNEYPQDIKAVGFRFFYWHGVLFPTVLRYILQDTSIKILHLRRHNILENLISLRLAEKTNQWISYSSQKKKYPRISLSYNECVSYFTDIEILWQRHDNMVAHRSLPVSYELLKDRKESETSKILSYLGLPKLTLYSAIKKQNTRSPREVIINYDVLKHRFKGSRWEKFFY